MNKPYWNGAGSRAGSSYADDAHSPTHRISDHGSSEPSPGFYSGGGYRTTDEYRSVAAEPFDDEYDDYDYDDGSDNRWRWIAGLAVAVLVAAVIATTMVMRSDNTSSTAQSSETAPPATSTTHRTVIATVPPSTAPPQAQLAPETVVTITTTPSAAAPAPPAGEPIPPPEAAPPAPGTRTITYSVTGSRQLFDLVTIIYTDEQGLPRTDVNVALPWSKTVVLNPGVNYESVTATSVAGQLNCAITDAAGAALVTQANNSMIATCTG